jgi:lipocalin
MQVLNHIWSLGLVAMLLPAPGQAAPVRDLSVPMVAVAQYDSVRLLGSWFEVAQTPSLLEQNCHGTTARVEARDDSRLTLKIACHKGSLSGKVLPIEGVMAETEPGIFQLRLVHLMEMGNLQLVVLWQAPDDRMVAIGSPLAQVGWVWSKTATPDPTGLEDGKQALIAAGYRANAIKSVEQAP